MSYPPQGGQPPQGYPAPPPGYGYPQGQPAIEYASWISRVGASLVDALPNLFLMVIAIVIVASKGPALVAVLLYLVALAFSIWNRFIRTGKTGQSIGKQALGIRLVSQETGQPIGGLMAFVRDLAHFLDSIACSIGYLWPLWDQQRQTFADKVMNTIVIK